MYICSPYVILIQEYSTYNSKTTIMKTFAVLLLSTCIAATTTSAKFFRPTPPISGQKCDDYQAGDYTCGVDRVVQCAKTGYWVNVGAKCPRTCKIMNKAPHCV